MTQPTPHSYSIGIDLGGTNLRIAAYSSEAEQLDAVAAPQHAQVEKLGQRDAVLHENELQRTGVAARRLADEIADAGGRHCRRRRSLFATSRRPIDNHEGSL